MIPPSRAKDKKFSTIEKFYSTLKVAEWSYSWKMIGYMVCQSTQCPLGLAHSSKCIEDLNGRKIVDLEVAIGVDRNKGDRYSGEDNDF